MYKMQLSPTCVLMLKVCNMYIYSEKVDVYKRGNSTEGYWLIRVYTVVLYSIAKKGRCVMWEKRRTSPYGFSLEDGKSCAATAAAASMNTI
jgi:hypothetical protein